MHIKRKKIIALMMCGVTLIGVTGCNSVKNVEPLSLEEVAGRRLANVTSDERDILVFEQVSGRITVDKDNLIKIPSKDMNAINKLINNVGENLKGVNNKALSNEFANYLLTEFAKTPYEWQQSKLEAVGYDPATRLYFVDVEYNTTGALKSAVPSSKIPNGSDTEVVLKQKRYEDYLEYMNYKYNSNPVADQKYTDFVARWGDVNLIMEEQQGLSLLERTRKRTSETGGIGRLTYAGLVSDSRLNQSAKMKVRYVLKYKHNLGEETDLEVNSLYVKEYKLGNPEQLLGQYSAKNNKGVEVLKPFVDKLILSYNKAVETTNNTGLNSLFDNYGTIDKYYADLKEYSYTNFGGYKYKILERNGTSLVVQVDRVVKNRAKGADMSLATYQETSIFNLVLDNDDSLKIKSVYPIESKMIGEPMSVIKDVSGISNLIQYSSESFTKENEKKVEDVLKKFSKAVYKGTVDTPEFNETVDMGVSQVTLKKMASAIQSLKSDKKTTYIVNYNTKSNSFVSVTLRDIFETDSGNYDTESIVDLANTNGEWKIIDYTRTLNVQTEKTEISSKNALCVDGK